MLYNFLVLEIDIITFCVFIFLKFLLGMYCVIMMSCFFYSYIEQFHLFFIINACNKVSDHLREFYSKVIGLECVK